MPQLPPLDTHAHIALDIPARDLEGLGAVVFAATRSVDEFQQTLRRADRVTIWGVGSHPALVGVQRAFDQVAFARAVQQTPFISEIGLDGSSRVPLAAQTQTFRQILEVLARTPRIASIHSHQAHSTVLDELETGGVRAGVVLHWWLGGEGDTARAVRSGAYFSVNYSMIKGSDTWRSLPLDLLLTETDHPAGDRFSPKPRQPGRVEAVEEALALAHGVEPLALRRQVWKNFARLTDEAGVRSMLPPVVQAMLHSAR